MIFCTKSLLQSSHILIPLHTGDQRLSPVMAGNSSKLDNATLSMFQNENISIIISVIYLFVTVINLLGNGLSMWLLLFRTSPKSPSIIFMINLTITDLALGAALPFQIAYQLQQYNWTLGPRMCRYSYYRTMLNLQFTSRVGM